MVSSKRVAGALVMALGVGVQAEYSPSLPTVDLGYELHRASNFNATGGFYNFSNIRYAAPPVGKLRFALPHVPSENRTAVQTGDTGRICPQASPAWSGMASQFLISLILGASTKETTPYIPPGSNASSIVPPQDPRTSEDCLFLDVFAPQKLFDAADKGKGAPVLVWIYGGGYTGGNKYTNPAGLLAASGNVSNGEVVYVAMNYRLGALGWSGGPSYQTEGGTSNLGLHDQRFALEWVQKYIHLFGGDPKRVTIVGESAGGGSIMHQITAYGGLKGHVPFQRAVPQSPAWQPLSSQLQQEDRYRRLLDITNSTSLADLRALSSDQIIRANYLQIAYDSAYGTYTYGPAVDGDFVPLQPGQLLAQGRYDKNVSVMVGHNANESPYFTPPYVNTTESLLTALKGTFPYLPDAAATYITDVLYPPVFDGKYGYKTQFERAALIVSESSFTCNTNYLATAFGNKTYSYLFAVPPAFHGFDVAYTFYTGGAVSTNPLDVTNRTIAVALQDFITSFAITGRPSAPGIRHFDMYGPNAQVLDLNITGITEVRDVNANARCSWWQKALYT